MAAAGAAPRLHALRATAKVVLATPAWLHALRATGRIVLGSAAWLRARRATGRIVLGSAAWLRARRVTARIVLGSAAWLRARRVTARIVLGSAAWLHALRATGRIVLGSAAWLTMAGLLASPTNAVSAQVAQPDLPRVVSEQPSVLTPHVLNGSVDAFAQIGNVMYAGGTFTRVSSPDGSQAYLRPYLMAFDVRTGEILPDSPRPNSKVIALEPAPDGSALYVGGRFSQVDGVLTDRIAKIDPATHEVDPDFRPRIDGRRVSDLGFANGRLIASGAFTERILALDPATGRDTGYLNLLVTGRVDNGDYHFWPDVYRFAINAQQTQMVIIGNFDRVNVMPREQVALINLEPDGVSLSMWHSHLWNKPCAEVTPWYTRDVDWMQDGEHFVVVTTGHNFPGKNRLCSSASMWRSGPMPNDPVWVNYTGGNSLFSVAATSAAVYVGGHPRWLNNPFGDKTAGPGAVERQGIGAIDPSTGLALPWNPTRARGHGAQALYPTSDGLWVGSDTETFAGEYRGRIAFTPLD